MAAGWGAFKDAEKNPAPYRRTVRETVYAGLAYRNPILLTWGKSLVEDERIVFDEVRRAMDWSTPLCAAALGPRHRARFDDRGKSSSPGSRN